MIADGGNDKMEPKASRRILRDFPLVVEPRKNIAPAAAAATILIFIAVDVFLLAHLRLAPHFRLVEGALRSQSHHLQQPPMKSSGKAGKYWRLGNGRTRRSSGTDGIRGEKARPDRAGKKTDTFERNGHDSNTNLEF